MFTKTLSIRTLTIRTAHSVSAMALLCRLAGTSVYAQNAPQGNTTPFVTIEAASLSGTETAPGANITFRADDQDSAADGKQDNAGAKEETAANPPAQEDEDEPQITLTKKSLVLPFTLPEGAIRCSGKKVIGPLLGAIKTLAEKNEATTADPEVLLWQGKPGAKKAVIALLKEAGYKYAPQTTVAEEGTRITPFACTRKGKAEAVIGFWSEQDDKVILTWAIATPKDESARAETIKAKSETPSSADILPASKSKATPGKTAVKTANIGTGKVPADLMGEWSWTTVGSVNYVDTVTKTMAEPSGMSCRFTFTKDGRYKKFFTIRQRTYSLVSEATTTEEGTVTFDADSFTMRPEKGHYKGHTGSRIIDRPMTDAERKITTYRWEWRTTDGKRQLYLGPSTESLKGFKPAK